jgi:predicted membrane-bound dolichyl-phosphate-mannose-protein mannosyltransferase
LVLVAAFVARVAWLNLPDGGLIFDEAYYVNAARVLLGWPVAEGAHYAGSPAGLDPNTEHPPLGKLLIALSMSVFGDTGIGWRIPSIIAGLVAIAAVYRIVRASGETPWLAILVVGILAFDNLTLVHGRIATLDMLVLAPILV